MNSIILTLLSLILISCASVSDYETVKNEKDLFIIQHKKSKQDFGPIRDNKKNLIRDKEIANKRMSSFNELDELKKNKIPQCSGGIEQSERFHKIEKLIVANKIKKARKQLYRLKENCDGLEYNSNYYYTLAYTYELEGNKEKRDENLNNFINKSQQIYPGFTHQTNSKEEATQLYKQYIQNAKDVLNGKEFTYSLSDKKHLKVARYIDRTNSFLPGYENEEGRVFLVLPSYSTVTGGGISALYNFNTKYGEFIPAYSYNEITKGLGSLIFRKQISQSLDRRHTTGINIGLFQWKKIRYRTNYYTREASDVRILDEGIGVSAGYGGTYQLTNRFLYIYQARAYSSQESGISGTSLIGYNFNNFDQKETFLLEYGLFNNDSIAGARWGIIHIFQNLSAETFNFQLYFGF